MFTVKCDIGVHTLYNISRSQSDLYMWTKSVGLPIADKNKLLSYLIFLIIGLRLEDIILLKSIYHDRMIFAAFPKLFL